MIYSDSTDSEKEVMDAYGVKSFSDLFNEPIFRNTSALDHHQPAGSPAHIEETRMKDVLNRYVPELVMSSPDQFENIWQNYVKDIKPLMVEQMKVYQEEIDWRMENW